jgi:hypothetical protein
MPAAPKDTSTPLPRVSIRRGSAHIAKRFFRGRRGLRRTLFLLALVAIYYFLIRPDDNPYDMQFIDDNDEDLVQHPSSAYRDRISAMKAVQKERQRKARTRPPMTRSRDGLIRVGNWDGRHPLFEIIDTAEREWKAELDYRPSTVRLKRDRYVHTDSFSSYRKLPSLTQLYTGSLLLHRSRIFSTFCLHSVHFPRLHPFISISQSHRRTCDYTSQVWRARR